MFVAIVIAVFEFTWKQRKLAVDENVSRLCSHFLVTKPDRCAPPATAPPQFLIFLKSLTIPRPSAFYKKCAKITADTLSNRIDTHMSPKPFLFCT